MIKVVGAKSKKERSKFMNIVMCWYFVSLLFAINFFSFIFGYNHNNLGAIIYKYTEEMRKKKKKKKRKGKK